MSQLWQTCELTNNNTKTGLKFCNFSLSTQLNHCTGLLNQFWWLFKYMSTRILVIDDEEAVTEILKFNLEKEGYEVDCAYSAEEALDMDLGLYQLFMVDIMMDQLSGYDFCKTCAQCNSRQSRLPYFSVRRSPTRMPL